MAVDLIAVAALIHMLAPDRVLASPPALGDGTVATAHGLAAGAGAGRARPAEGPADGRGAGRSPEAGPLAELTTPTGAALLAHLAAEFGPLPAGRVRAWATAPAGASSLAGPTCCAPCSSRDAARRGRWPTPLQRAVDAFELLETNIDDLPRPRCWPTPPTCCASPVPWTCGSTRRLDEEEPPGDGAARLARPACASRGGGDVPRDVHLRLASRRRSAACTWRSGARASNWAVDAVAVRLGYLDGHLVTASPEYEDCRAVAAAVERPLKVVYEAAQAAAWSRFGGV